MTEGLISYEHLILIITAATAGFLARLLTLKEDYRQYPTYPSGYLIHLVTGFIAGSLGAVAVPAIITKNFVAVTFLALAIQQFRDVRKIEKNSLEDLEQTEFTQRGNAYIDGISKTFESRNYFALVVSLTTGVTMQVLFSLAANDYLVVIIGLFAGAAVFIAIKQFSKGLKVGDIAGVVPGKVSIKANELFVDDIFVSNLVVTDNAMKMICEEAIAVVLKPNEEHYRITLDNFGQRQAILFEVTRSLGVKRYSFTRKDYLDGRIVFCLVPIKNDIDAMVEVVKKTPVLENTKKADKMMKTPLEGQKA